MRAWPGRPSDLDVLVLAAGSALAQASRQQRGALGRARRRELDAEVQPPRRAQDRRHVCRGVRGSTHRNCAHLTRCVRSVGRLLDAQPCILAEVSSRTLQPKRGLWPQSAELCNKRNGRTQGGSRCTLLAMAGPTRQGQPAVRVRRKHLVQGVRQPLGEGGRALPRRGLGAVRRAGAQQVQVVQHDERRHALQRLAQLRARIQPLGACMRAPGTASHAGRCAGHSVVLLAMCRSFSAFRIGQHAAPSHPRA